MTSRAQEKKRPPAAPISVTECLMPTKETASIPMYGPDSVHSWMTAGACCLAVFFSVAACRSSGFLYVAILRNFNATRAEAAWIIIVMTGVLFLGGFVSGPIAHKYTGRPVVLAGSVIAAAGLMLSYFATSTGYLVVTLAVIHGVGSGMVFVVTPMLINEHFIHYRRLAMGINFAGSTMAMFAFPKALEILTDNYGFKGAMLVFSAICLNSLAFSLLLRQPTWLTKSLTEEPPVAAAKIPAEAGNVLKSSRTNCDEPTTPYQKRVAPGTFRHGLTVFRSPMFYVIAYSYMCFMLAFDCYVSLLIDFATDRGVTFSDAVTMVSVSSIADLVSRLALTAAADRVNFPSRTLLMVIFFLMGTLFLLLPLASGYWWLFAFTSAIAFCIGTPMCLFSVLVAEYLGIERQSMAYGFVCAFTGMTYLVKPFLVGYFRDTVGAYDSLFMICGSTLIMAAIIWTVVHLMEYRWRAKRREPMSSPRRTGVQDSAVEENNVRFQLLPS